MRSIHVGGLPPSTALLDNLQLPVIQDLEAIAWAMDALVHAAADRKGVALISEKGAGKTMALRSVINDFDDAERLKETLDARYARRRTVLVHSPRSKDRSEILGVIWKAALGLEMNRRLRGRRKPDDLLLDELVEHFLHQNIAVLVFDEAESLSAEAFDLIRDMISIGESKSKERFTGKSYSPAGIGVLIAGTPRVRDFLVKTDEAAHRWLRFQEIAPLAIDEAAGIYRRFLRAFDERAAEIGEEAWVDFIRLKVARGRSLPVRSIENHVRTYVRRVVVDHMVNEEPEIESPDDVPFNEEIFFQALEELSVQSRVNAG